MNLHPRKLRLMLLGLFLVLLGIQLSLMGEVFTYFFGLPLAAAALVCFLVGFVGACGPDSTKNPDVPPGHRK